MGRMSHDEASTQMAQHRPLALKRPPPAACPVRALVLPIDYLNRHVQYWNPPRARQSLQESLSQDSRAPRPLDRCTWEYGDSPPPSLETDSSHCRCRLHLWPPCCSPRRAVFVAPKPHQGCSLPTLSAQPSPARSGFPDRRDSTALQSSVSSLPASPG